MVSDPKPESYKHVTTTDRRRTVRHPARHNSARLEWADGRDFLEMKIRLVDVSHGGARFVSAEAPPLDRQVWLRLERPVATGWVSAKVVRVGESFESGLSFTGYCPFDLFEGATAGIGFGNLN
jgi:hypothetical protein